MKTIHDIQTIYKELLEAYAPITQQIIKKLMNMRGGIERVHVMFPPRDSDSFDAKQAEAGFLKYDCAILTAFRATRTRHGNHTMNGKLLKDLESNGFGIIRVDGCYREAREMEASREDSFFVYLNGNARKEDFFIKIYQLSEKYGQDSFLFKCAGMTRTAFLVSTNDDARQQMGNIQLAGQLYLNLPPIGPYSDLGQAGERIAFLVEKPEDLLKVAETK